MNKLPINLFWSLLKPSVKWLSIGRGLKNDQFCLRNIETFFGKVNEILNFSKIFHSIFKLRKNCFKVSQQPIWNIFNDFEANFETF